MRSWLAGMAAVIVCVAAPGGAAGEPIDCGPAPTVTCLSDAIFALANTLPDDSQFRRSVEFAQRELVPGDIKIALRFVLTDNPDPSPWDEIEWIAQSGRFDRAIKLARQRSAPVERLGGLLAVATSLLDRNDGAQAARLVDEVERALPSSAATDSDEYAGALPRMTAEIRARLGQTERTARLLGNRGSGSLSALLAIASKYPAAASLREQVWQEAERVNQPRVWQLLLEDAKSRADKADMSRAAQRASRRMDGEIRDGDFDAAISLAPLLLEAGAADLPARLARQWGRWIEGKEARRQSIIVKALIPLLVDLALDQDVRLAANAVTDLSDRSQCLSRAADEYFRVGRNDVARALDAEAFRVAMSSPPGEPNQQWANDAALHNLALARAGRGDIQGALDAATELRDEKRVRELTFYIVRRAIDSGHGPVAGPAIQALEQQAGAAQDASLLLQAASYWYEVGQEEGARRGLAQAMKTAEVHQSALAAGDAGIAAELMWRINGNGEARALLDTVDKLQVDDPGAIDHLVEILIPVSPAVAVKLAGRQLEVERRIGTLANIAVQIAEARK